MTDTDRILQRGDCFKLLAACFYEPDRELFMSERLGENLTDLLTACECHGAAAVASGLRTALATGDPEELLVEHARLFIGPFSMLAPPYGSVYLEQSGRLMGDSTLAVQKLYREAGLALEIKEAPDHIALELEFMHYLCLKEAEAASANAPQPAGEFALRQTEFMNRYLRPWVPRFCNKIRSGTENRFYRVLADCLERFTTEDAQDTETISPLQQSVYPDAGRASL